MKREKIRSNDKSHKTRASLLEDAIDKKVHEEKTNWYEWKIKKLRTIVNYFVPEHNEVILDTDSARVAVSAMNELNKMEGDYSADKRINFNANVDSDTETVNILLKEYKRDF